MGVEPGAKLFDWHEPKVGQKAGFGKWKNPKSAYDRFIEDQGIPIHRDHRRAQGPGPAADTVEASRWPRYRYSTAGHGAPFPFH